MRPKIYHLIPSSLLRGTPSPEPAGRVSSCPSSLTRSKSPKIQRKLHNYVNGPLPAAQQKARISQSVRHPDRKASIGFDTLPGNQLTSSLSLGGLQSFSSIHEPYDDDDNTDLKIKSKMFGGRTPSFEVEQLNFSLDVDEPTSPVFPENSARAHPEATPPGACRPGVATIAESEPVNWNNPLSVSYSTPQPAQLEDQVSASSESTPRRTDLEEQVPELPGRTAQPIPLTACLSAPDLLPETNEVDRMSLSRTLSLPHDVDDCDDKSFTWSRRKAMKKLRTLKHASSDSGLGHMQRMPSDSVSQSSALPTPSEEAECSEKKEEIFANCSEKNEEIFAEGKIVIDTTTFWV